MIRIKDILLVILNYLCKCKIYEIIRKYFSKDKFKFESLYKNRLEFKKHLQRHFLS